MTEAELARQPGASIAYEDKIIHLYEVRRLIEAWQNKIRTPMMHETLLTQALLAEVVERKPLFRCLQDHLPLQNLWENYNLWKNSAKEYLTSRWEMKRRIRNKVLQLLQYAKGANKQSGVWFSISDKFEKPILKRISEKTLGNQATKHKFDNGFNMVESIVSHSTEFSEIGKDVEVYDLFVDNILVAQCFDVSFASEEYQRISDYYLTHEETAKLVEIFHKSRNEETAVRSKIRYILSNNVYTNYSCEQCPSLSKPKGGKK